MLYWIIDPNSAWHTAYEEYAILTDPTQLYNGVLSKI